MRILRLSLLIALFLCFGTAQIRADDAADRDLEVSRLARRLTTSSNPTTRLVAIAKLADLKPQGGAATRALCQAMLDPVPEIRSRAGRLLEKTAADIYWPVRSLTRGDESFNHSHAIA